MAAANYTDHVAAIAERIGEARDQATVHALLVEGVHALGAENAVFVSFIRDNAVSVRRSRLDAQAMT